MRAREERHAPASGLDRIGDMLTTIAWASIAIGAFSAIAGLVILYFVIFLAVRAALRSHSVWLAQEQEFAARVNRGVYVR